MSFWFLNAPATRAAVPDQATGQTWTYGELARLVADLRAVLARSRRNGKQLGFLFARNTPAALAAYLAALQVEDALALLPPGAGMDDRLLRAYRPDWIVSTSALPAPPGYARAASRLDGLGWSLWLASQPLDEPPHESLALMLSTSGSTGSPKFVRLSARNLDSNAEAIRSYLSLSEEERPITTLPFFYSYGLSVLNSHLAAGATLLFTEKSQVERAFWTFAGEARATSMAGVPFNYQMLHRMRFDPGLFPELRTFTQAGGRLDRRHKEAMLELAGRHGRRFFVMYGQTEATARISYVPAERLGEKLDSIGIPIPGGRLEVAADTGELIYTGPNVMLGYAQSREDLSRGDECGGRLATGDVGTCDRDGYFTITGRLKRFIKLFGQRVNLDEIEVRLAEIAGRNVACAGRDDTLRVAVEDASASAAIVRQLGEVWGFHASAWTVTVVAELPRTSSGKLDYQELDLILSPS